MFQPHVFFEAYTHNSGIRERYQRTAGVKSFNSTLFLKREGVTATSLGQRPSKGGIIITRILKVIHRAPSVEGVTATSLGTLLVVNKHIKKNRKNAPNKLFLKSKQKKQRSAAHGA